MVEHPRITTDPDVMVGKPVIRGTRIALELIIGLLAQGWTEQDILAAFRTSRARTCVPRVCSGPREFGESISDRGSLMRFLADYDTQSNVWYTLTLTHGRTPRCVFNFG